jgi:hypothetical protein
VYVGKKKKRMRKCEEFFSSYVWKGVHGRGVCKNQAWKEVVCNKYLWQSLWIFGSISCSSQIHGWICVKFESVLVWKV